MFGAMHAPETLPAALYRDPALYETERRQLFARSWQLAAHAAQFGSTGAYLTISIAGYPLLLVRGEDGHIRAFHNVCRHRAGPLAEDGQGVCATDLVCRYHGWRYALDGRLASARDFGPAEGFDPRAYGLISVSCEVWRGFVFINMDRTAPPLATAIAPLAERMRDLPLETFLPGRQSRHEIRCNWKVYVENYLEGYHIPLVHPGLNAFVDSSRYEVEVAGTAVFHHAPPRNGVPVAGLWAWLWPCLGVNVYGRGLMMERMSPLDHARTRLDYLYFFPSEAAEGEQTAAILSSEATTAEDLAITEAVQRNLNAGIYETGRLSPKHEQGVALFQNLYARAMAE